jgi:Fe-S-cluster containining protein
MRAAPGAAGHSAAAAPATARPPARRRRRCCSTAASGGGGGGGGGARAGGGPSSGATPAPAAASRGGSGGAGGGAAPNSGSAPPAAAPPGGPVPAFEDTAASVLRGRSFHCTACGRCCTMEDGGEVWVSRQEIRGIARFLGVPGARGRRPPGLGWALGRPRRALAPVLAAAPPAQPRRPPPTPPRPPPTVADAIARYCEPSDGAIPGWWRLKSQRAPGGVEVRPGAAGPSRGRNADRCRPLRGCCVLSSFSPGPALTPRPQLSCTFLDTATNACTVHAARPVQVSLPSNLPPTPSLPLLLGPWPQPCGPHALARVTTAAPRPLPPPQCSTYPWWPELLAEHGAWDWEKGGRRTGSWGGAWSWPLTGVA